MKYQYQQQNRLRGEEGMAVLITLMMGLLLLAGSSGLMARMMMGRKVGSSESYQQMAEQQVQQPGTIKRLTTKAKT